MKGREIVDFITREGLLNEDLFLTDVYGNTYGYMTIEEYAACIGAGPAVVEALIKRGDLDYVVIHGQTLIRDNMNTDVDSSKNISKMNKPSQVYIISVPNVKWGMDIISKLESTLTEYGKVTISDLHDATGTYSNTYTDNLYGWTNFGDGLNIEPVGFGLVIELPEPIRLGVY